MQCVAPVALVGCRKRGRASGQRDGRGSGVRVHETHDNGDRSAVLIKVSDRITQPALGPQPAENPFEVAETGDGDRLVHWSPGGASDESRDRSGDTRDGADPAWNLFDVHARIGRCYRHRAPPLLRLGDSPSFFSLSPPVWQCSQLSFTKL